MRIAIAGCMALTIVPAVASERTECFLTGSGYENENYPSCRQAIWFIDGTTLRQQRVGEMKGLATMTVVRRDEKVLIAEWSHTLPEGSTYRSLWTCRPATRRNIAAPQGYRGPGMSGSWQ